MKEKNLQPIHVYNMDGTVDTSKTFYFGSKATTRTTKGGNLILKVFNTDVLKIMTTGRVEVTHWLPRLDDLALKAINHLLKIHPNNLMEKVNKKDLTEKELFRYKKKVKVTKKSKVKDVVFTLDKNKMEKQKSNKQLIQDGELESLPF